jgi:septal ring-binding cell division protein DamX
LIGGPFGTREAARDAIEKMPAALKLRPFVVKRD